MVLFGKKFLVNDEILESEYFKKIYKFKVRNVYEVVRICDGSILFWNDHFNRLKNSILKLTGNNIDLNDIEFKIENVVNENEISNGNIKIEILFDDSDNFDLYIYPIKFYYPNENVGIDVITYNIERNNPSIKTYDIFFKETVRRVIEENDVYEILMLNKNGYITEGSRTNVYFVKDKCFFTASEDLVLSGVTRKRVNEIIKELGFNLIEESIHMENVFSFDCCFLTSTSSNVLPVKKINGVDINSLNNVNMKKVQQLFRKYFQN